MRRTVVALVLSVGLIAASPANAASTRAEYIAQVDPICQSFVGAMGDAWGAYHRAYKRMIRLAKSGTPKAFLRQTRRTAGSLNQLARTRTSMTDQIAVVPPPTTDAGTVGTWLGYLRNEEGFEVSAASALRRLAINKFFKRLRQADKAETAGTQVISGFGFQACGNFPVV
jgi:hypothetical protein